MNRTLPLVSIITPVYNGEKYLAECIESVLNQEYSDWEYIIVNNCSTDSTYEIAEKYSKIDQRICVINNTEFLNLIENHNRAFGLISPLSKYCKVVSSDDWIYPLCLKKMVDIAEAYPTVAVVGSYQRSGEKIRWKGIPEDRNFISGKEVCRKALLEKFVVFGAPTSVLYRSDLIRKTPSFFPNSYLYADTCLFYVILRENDLGFVHEVLSEERIHDMQVSSIIHDLHIGGLAYLDIFMRYGHDYLKPNEFEIRKNELIRNYYTWLGGCVLKLYGLEFWKYQINKMREIGIAVSWINIIVASVQEIKRELKNPKDALQKVIKVFIFGEKLE